MKPHDIVVVGAGISGLSLAHYCVKAGFDTLVVDKSESAGGCFASHRFGGDASGFWIELGAHTCYNSYGNLLGILEDCNVLGRLIKREKVGYKILVGDRLKSIPSQLNFGELIFSVPRMFRLKKAGESVQSYYSKIVGKRNFERVFGPAFNAVISQKANDFPAEVLFKKRPRRKDILKSFTLTGGLRTIIESITSQDGFTFLTGQEVRAFTLRNDIFDVETAEGTHYEAGAVAVATPAPVTAKLLQQSFPELSEPLSQIRAETTETFGVAIKKNNLSLSPLAGIIAVDDSFYSVVSRDTVPHETYRGFTFHFKPGRLDRDGKVKRICEVLGVKPGQLEQVINKENCVPSLVVGHERLISTVDRLVAGKRLLLTGNYFSGMAIEDCVSRSLGEFSRLKNLINGKAR